MAAPTTPMDTARAFVDAICRGDIAGMDGLMTEDFAWRFVPESLGALKRNKRDYLLQSAELGSLFASLKIHMNPPLDAVQTENAVVMHVLGEGELASGERHSSEYMMTFECEDRKVKRMTEFVDSESMRRVLGAGGGAGYKLITKVY